MSVSEDIDINELTHPEDEQDPRATRTEDHISRIQERFESSGWLSPIIFTAEDKLIVDGNTRVKALEDLDENYQLQVLGEFQGYVYAIPDTDLEIDPEEASAELNIFRENLIEPERAQFLSFLVKSRVINNDRIRVAGDAISTPELLSNLENDKRDDRSYEWEHDEKAKSELNEFLSALDFDSPGRARTVLSNYDKAPSRMRELWLLDELYSGHIEELNNIRELLDGDGDLSHSSTARNDQFEEIVEYSRKEYEREEEYYRRDDLRDIVEELGEKEDQPSPDNEDDEDDEDEDDEEDIDDRFEKIESNLNTESVEKLSALRDRIKSETQLLRSLEDADDTVKRVNEWADFYQNSKRTSLEERKKERKQDLEEFDFSESRAAGKVEHLAPPIETKHLGVYFHDCLDMDDEIENESVHLVFTSPPYFTQRERIVEKFWPADGSKTQANADIAYENYLDEIMEVIEKCHKKLSEGGHLMLNVSDYKVEGLSKIYDIPSDFSSRIRNDEELSFEYVSTITWDKDSKTSSRLANFRGSNNIVDFKPAWRTERILVFRKGEKREKKDYTIDRTALKTAYANIDLFADLWKVNPTTGQDAAHEAGFPIKLPELAVKLFTYPGDTVIDPFGGWGTTLRAVKKINKEDSETSPRKGFAWENFDSETSDQRDYRKLIQSQLGSLGNFMT